MNKSQLLQSLEPTITRHSSAAEVLDAVLDAIVREVSAGGRVVLTGFGTFEQTHRAARTGRNPRTGGPVAIADRPAPRFRAAPRFMGYVNDPASLPLDELTIGHRGLKRTPAQRWASDTATPARPTAQGRSDPRR